jgi:hypothetical protein
MSGIIIIYGGLPGEPDHATVDGAEVIRRPGESLDAFVLYCRELMKDEKDNIVGGGGLPD